MTPLTAAAALLLTSAVTSAHAEPVLDALRASQQGLVFNAHALGMGNAYSTIGYDVSALLFNPATMAVSPKVSWTVSANADGFKSTTDYYGHETAFRTSSTSTGQIGLTMPFKLDSTRAVVVGFAYTQTNDLRSGFKYSGVNDGTSFASFAQLLAGNDDPTARLLGLSYPVLDGSGNRLRDASLLGGGLVESGYRLASGGLTHYSMGASVAATTKLFVGASATYNGGNYDSDLEMAGVDFNNVYPSGIDLVPGDARTDDFISADYRVSRRQDFEGWDARVGMMYNLWNFIGVSASFHLPAPQKIRQETFSTGTSTFASHTFVDPGSRSVSTFHYQPPTEMTVGAMTHLWIVTGAAEATYVDYPSMRVTSGGGEIQDRTLLNKRINDELAAQINLNLGAEVRLPFTGLAARAGGIYQPSPYRNDPAKFARKAITLGAGYNADNVAQVDLAYAYSWRGELDREGADGSNADENTGLNTLLFTFRVTF